MMVRSFIVLIAAVAGFSLAGISTPVHADSSLTWDWILGGKLPGTPPAVDYLDLDGFDTPASYVTAAKANSTKTICYISVGTLENWRPDKKAFKKLDRKQRGKGKPAIIGKKYPEWPGERWLNFKRYKVFLKLMVARMKMCRSKGFELVEFDNLDAYENRTGFNTAKRHAVKYARALAKKANKTGLVAVHKNTPELNKKLEPYFGAQLLEDCALYKFCDESSRYRAAGKPVFNAEYPEAWDDEGKTFKLTSVCATANNADISLIVKNLDLDDWVQRCP